MRADTGMGSTGPQPTQNALLNLERSSAPLTELLDEAARILGLEFAEIRDDLFSECAMTYSRKTTVFAPKEEWTLRWLLKKTKPGAKTASSGSEPKLSANHDPRKWLLFYHLVRRTSVKKVAKNLRDQDGMHQIQDVLSHLIETQNTSTSTSPVSAMQCRPSSSELEGNEYEIPQGESKKRKRSPGPKDPVDKEPSIVLIILSILRALEVCLEHAFATNREDPVSQQYMRIALSSAPETAASILEHVFRIVYSILRKMPKRSSLSGLLHILPATSGLWDLRHGPDLGHTLDECNNIFTSSCLLPCLSLLEYMRYSELRDQHKDLETWLEKIVVQHAVEPARKVFFNDLALKRKSDQDPMLSEHIKPSIGRLETLLFAPRMVASKSAGADDAVSAFSLVAPVLLELAIRSCLRSTVRKSQHEHPWLEALFVGLAHLGGSSLIENGETVQATHEKRDMTVLEGLLSTMIRWKVSISLPLLSSVAQNCTGLLQNQSTDWAIVARIMQLDTNVFVPNSGMPSAKKLLDQLIGKLSSQPNNLEHDSNLTLNLHSLIDLVKLLMEGFACARDLGTFVNIWMNRLAEVEDARTSNFKLRQPIVSYSLWEDEDVIAEFSRVAKTSATPTFITSHLTATAQALSEKNYSGKHYALITVLDVLVATHKEEIGSARDIVELLYGRLQIALQTIQTSSKLIGILWRLVRHISPLIEKDFPVLLFEDLINGKDPAIIEKAMNNANKGPSPHLTMINFNEVERFHCFVTLATTSASPASKHLDLEIKSLTYNLAKLRSRDKRKESVAAKLWDGRATSLEGRLELSAAFLGILLQNSQVLCFNIETTGYLLKAVATHLATKDESGENLKAQGGVATLFEGLLLDEALISTPGLVKKCVEATGLIGECPTDHRQMAIIQALPKGAFSKAQRKQVAEWQREKLATSKEKATDALQSEMDRGDSTIAKEGVVSSMRGSEMTYGELQQSCRIAREAEAVQTRDDVVSLCESLRKEPFSRANFLLLGSMLNKGEKLSPHATGLAADLSTLLPNSTSLEKFCLTADCIKILLDKHHDSVNQWTIDTLLAQIAITTSTQGPTIPNIAPIIFERLCRLLGALLGRYRIRLGGRFHLLLPALYGLLHCLFALDLRSLTTQSQVLFHSKLPPWIRATSSKLSKDSATHLTRLLTSICDPTPSSVKRTHNSLTDETKKARNIAEQYMQYIIAEYTYCQLNGRIEVEAKAALMPGLYAVLNVMGREVTRGMNAKMDASQRAIFKGLYADYTRFGRWNGM